MEKVNIIYWSQTGNTQARAEAIGKGVSDAGKEAECDFCGRGFFGGRAFHCVLFPSLLKKVQGIWNTVPMLTRMARGYGCVLIKGQSEIRRRRELAVTQWVVHGERNIPSGSSKYSFCIAQVM